MDEAQLVHRFNSESDFGHVEARDIFREDLVFDKHCHEISTRQEVHKHI